MPDCLIEASNTMGDLQLGSFWNCKILKPDVYFVPDMSMLVELR